jgi:maltodextrin utilization protein YvdJ
MEGKMLKLISALIMTVFLNGCVSVPVAYEFQKMIQKIFEG